MEYSNNDLNNNFNNMNNTANNNFANNLNDGSSNQPSPKKSGKTGLVVLIILLLLVIAALVVLFVFKEKIFPTSQNVQTNQNTVVANTVGNTVNATNTSNTINQNAQNQLINSVKGYWIATTGDLFLAIIDTTDSLGSTTTNFSLTGGSGITSTTCTIDSNKITCSDKVYDYKMQGNNLILSYDNVTRNFTPSNYYQVSKQSKSYYANMMGYTITPVQLPQGEQITGEYTNNALVGTWELSSGTAQLVFAVKDGNLTVTKVTKATREIISDLPVGMNTKYIEFVNSSSLKDEVYQYQLKDNKTLVLSDVDGKGLSEYTKVSNETTPQLVITDED